MTFTAAWEQLKPYAWLVLAAFLTGFASYVLFGGGAVASAREEPRVTAIASAPAGGEWNLPKRI